MRKRKLLFIPMMLAPLAIVSINQTPAFVKAEAKYTPNKYSESMEVYYKDIDPSVHPYDLLEDIKDLTDKNHKEWATYNDFGSGEMYRYTDAYIGKEETHFRDFYSMTAIPHKWDSNKYSREHVWCAHHSCGLWGRKDDTEDGKDHAQEGGGVDVHHLRPLLKSYNSSRSDNIFTEYGEDNRIPRVSHGVQFGWDPKDPNASSAYFEPLDEMKGDIARILMYCFIHYNTPKTIGKNLPSPTDRYIGDRNFFLMNGSKAIRRGDLYMTEIIVKDTNVTPTNKSSFEILLKWHKQDPVDQYEINRNEAGYGIQGNRNPFIDHPEWADIVFASDIDQENVPVEPGTEITPTTPDNPDTPTDPQDDLFDTKTIIIAATATVIIAITVIVIIVAIYKKKHK